MTVDDGNKRLACILRHRGFQPATGQLSRLGRLGLRQCGRRSALEEIHIRPTSTWRSSSIAWDPKAEALHGLSVEKLLVNGVRPRKVVKQLNDILAGCRLYADSPFDRRWLGMLFDEAGIAPTFELSRLDAYALILRVADGVGLGDRDYTAAERETSRRAPRTHRAADDAAHLATLWKLVCVGYRAPRSTRMALRSVRIKPSENSGKGGASPLVQS
jgi:DNA polymerase III epsilon subunit-like protein